MSHKIISHLFMFFVGALLMWIFTMERIAHFKEEIKVRDEMMAKVHINWDKVR